jgi:hypothetical protein
MIPVAAIPELLIEDIRESVVVLLEPLIVPVTVTV